jgi:tetratricopeptide (TPR) repeat protein
MKAVDPLSATLDRGWDLAQRGDAQGAIACAKRALEIDPQSPEVHNLFGYSSALAGDSEEALAHYRQALALDDTYFEAMLNCAEVLMHPIGDYEEAVSMCNDALDYAETPEEVADCILLKVDALLAKGDTEAARRTMAHMPSGPFSGDHYMFMIGRAHYELGEFDKAGPFLDEAAKREPMNPDAYYYLGILRDEQGDTRVALDCFLKTRALDQGRPAPPWSPSPEAFGQLVKRTVTELDALLARHVSEAEVFVVDLPGAELIVDGVDPRALVLLDTPPPERTSTSGTIPGAVARLFVYQRNVERAAGSSEFLEDQLKRAFEREIEHVFDTPPVDKSKLN